MTTPSPDKTYDVIVVGSGASGSIAVKELTERGLEVLLLEAGPNITEADFETAGRPHAPGIDVFPRAKAALRGQPVQSRRAFFNDRVSKFLVNDWRHPYSSKGDRFLWIRGRQLGGRLHTYGRVLLRMSDFDFEPIDGLSDPWPIRYADLAPYYDRVERFLGIYGTSDALPHLPDGQYAGRARLNAAETEFKEKIEARWPDRKVVPWRYTLPYRPRVPAGVLAAQETGRLTIRTDAAVRRITYDPKTRRADGAVYVDTATRREHRVRASVVMLCASTIESVRILLNSADASNPEGLANSSGMLGRYFMDQTPSMTYGVLPGRTGNESILTGERDPFYPPTGGVYVPRFDNVTAVERSDFARGFAYQGSIGRIPVPEGSSSVFGLMGFGQMLPRYENRIALASRRRDLLGIPAPRIELSLTDNDRALMREQVRASREMAEYAGYRVDFAGSALGLDSRKVYPGADPVSRLAFRLAFKRSMAVGAAIHECGGARMGSDPTTSVLNEHNQAWDVPNLFVTDASSFVSSGDVGPTLTIMAMAARAGDYIARQLETGEL